MRRQYLSTQLESEFPPWIKERGEGLRLRGAVEIVHQSPTEVELCVREEIPYTVLLKLRNDGALFGACNCAAGRRGGGRCRHLWAGLRTAEDAALLPRAAGPQVPAQLAQALPARPAVQALPPRPAVQAPPPPPPAPPPPPPEPGWRQRVSAVHGAIGRLAPAARRTEAVEILYVVDAAASGRRGRLALEVRERRALARGGWSKPRPLRVTMSTADLAADPADREALALLLGASSLDDWGYRPGDRALGSSVALDGAVAVALLPRLCATGRCLLSLGRHEADLAPLAWDDGPPWELHLEARADGDGYVLGAHLRRGDERRGLDEAVLTVAAGLVIFDGLAARFDHGRLFPWITALHGRPSLRVPRADAGELALELIAGTPEPARLDLPEELRLEQVRTQAKPHLTVRRESSIWHPDRLVCELHFDYDGTPLRPGDAEHVTLDRRGRRVLVRDREGERRAEEQLAAAGVKTRASRYEPGGVRRELAPRRLPRAVRQLVAQGWHVMAEGEVYRHASGLNVGIRSGLDWFDLEGEVDFGGRKVPFPAALAALRRGETLVPLGDGELGLLPEEWLKRYGLAARVADHADGHIRFRASQIGFLDALLLAQPEVSADAACERARARLRSFEGLAPRDAPEGFVGELRGYQREGLSWLHFLDEFGFGGCLADDMGLGKTVQVLALLAGRHLGGAATRPSLVVAPRSLVFNWRSEAARFTPALRVLDHTGLERRRETSAFDGHDVVLTTYGTLRRDVLLLKDVEFDHVVLDEAQTIKNSASETAKAARLLRGRQRLALSGTPLENHLGELWSLFEFLNPGMLGRVTTLESAAGETGDGDRALVARALRPFILRRTKEQVASDLPAKTEQTLMCELDVEQRRFYDEIRDHYRASLLRRVEADGLERSKIHVLEALLRLRQAACHPALIDPVRAGAASAKLDTLLTLLGEVLEEGHKVLVFSQFTRLLALVRARLEAQGVTYEYLDGRTRDRAARVERFQTDAACPVFLVSLKAGGLGLNLTAAEYVFLLDPWWNPAVEAQAVDRTHRIGQDKPVFAYRLIAKDTVEEKVLKLQQSKRKLADAIIAADGSLMSNLKREDLELLLS
jgi:hypothetical protein